MNKKKVCNRYMVILTQGIEMKRESKNLPVFHLLHTCYIMFQLLLLLHPLQLLQTVFTEAKEYRFVNTIKEDGYFRI